MEDDGANSVERRLAAASSDIMGDAADNPAFLHVILSQVCLPYRQPEGRDYERNTGRAFLAVSAGHLFNPKKRRMELQGIPYGSRPRLLMAHLCTQAVRLQSPVIPIADTLTGFMRDLGISATGGKSGSIGPFKEQINRLTACRMQFAMDYGNGRAVQFNPAPVIGKAELWFPSEPEQRMLWPSEVHLSDDFFRGLKDFALPIDPRAYGALRHSARALDIYTWLAHRLYRVRAPGGELVPWRALQQQFGPEIAELRDFKKEAVQALRQVLAVYPKARVEQVSGGLRLFRSEPPVPPRVIVQGVKIGAA